MSPQAPYIGNPKDPFRSTPVQDWGPLPAPVAVQEQAVEVTGDVEPAAVADAVAAAVKAIAPDDGFPRDRLIAVGVSESVVADLAASWPEMTDEDRRWEADGIAKLSDDELVEWGASLEVPDGTIPEVETWAANHPLAYLAMRVALSHEQAKDKPRVTLVDHLTAVLAPTGDDAENSGS